MYTGDSFPDALFAIVDEDGVMLDLTAAVSVSIVYKGAVGRFSDPGTAIAPPFLLDEDQVRRWNLRGPYNTGDTSAADDYSSGTFVVIVWSIGKIQTIKITNGLQVLAAP